MQLTYDSSEGIRPSAALGTALCPSLGCCILHRPHHWTIGMTGQSRRWRGPAQSEKAR